MEITRVREEESEHEKEGGHQKKVSTWKGARMQERQGTQETECTERVHSLHGEESKRAKA